MTKNYMDKQRINVLLILGCIVIFVSSPLFSAYLYYGHDLDFHLNRIEGIKEALLAGEFPVRMQSWFFEGRGYPVSLYYGDLFLYFPALLRLLGLSVQNAYKGYLFLMNIGACGLMYFGAKGMVKDRRLAILAALLYSLAPYRLSCLYLRAAVGEAAAMCFYPLVFYGLYCIYWGNREDKKERYGWLYLAAGFFGLIHSHIISTFIAGLFVIFFLLMNLSKTFLKERIFDLMKAAGLTLLSSLWFLVPFAEYMQQDIRVRNLDTKGAFASHGVFFGQLLSVFPRANGASATVEEGLSTQYEMAFSLGGGLLLSLPLFLYCLVNLKKGKEAAERMGLQCFLLALLALSMTLLGFPWEAIEEAGSLFEMVTKSIQYPWRFLSIATLFLVIVAALGVYRLGKTQNRMFAYSVAMAMAILAFSSAGYYLSDYMNSFTLHKFRLIEKEDLDSASVGNGEYLPVEVEMNRLKGDLVYDNASVWVQETAWYEQRDGIEIACTNLSEQEESLRVPKIYYRDYVAVDSITGNRLETKKGSDGFLEVVLPPGFDGAVTVEFLSPWYWRLCEGVSLATVSCAVVLVIVRRRKEKKDEQSQG